MAQITFNIEVLTVSAPSFTKTAKGGYNQIEVAFKKDGKVEGKKLIDFKFPDVYKFFQTIPAGTKVQVTSEKNDGEKFWNWTIANQVSGGATEANSAGTPSNSVLSDNGFAGQPASREISPPRARVTGSNYETSAERAKRQVYIVRQSSINAAIELIKLNQKEGEQASSSDVIAVAKEFEAYVFEPKVVGKFDDMTDDIPF